MNPRPSFQRPPSVSLQPLILDNEKNIKVPLTLNLFLRDYQREGIQFFYRRYAENSGGLLGDDMGLVSNPCQKSCFRSFIIEHFVCFRVSENFASVSILAHILYTL